MVRVSIRALGVQSMRLSEDRFKQGILHPDQDVRGNVEEGVAETKALVDRFNEIAMAFAEPMSDDEMNALLEEQGKLQDAIDTAGAWELDRKLEISADALRLPPWDADVTKLSGGWLNQMIPVESAQI